MLMAAGLGVRFVVACTTADPSPDAADAGVDASDAAADTGADACVSGATASSGPADTHCSGVVAQAVSAASCVLADAGADADADADSDEADASDAGDDDAGDADANADADADAAPAACGYGATMFGQEGDDDACKYHVQWSVDSICEGTTPQTFTVKVTSKADGSPVTNIPGGLVIETFTSLADGGCDDQSKHAGPNTGASLVETPAGSGTYVGPVTFDVGGPWTLRFHIHEECTAPLADSPHGHAAFRIVLP
jgi:hypothetical protein